MYLREKRIKFLKLKNIVFTVLGTFFVASSLYVLISLVSHYHDDLKTVLEAKATPECVVLIIIGTVLLLTAGISRRLIGNANFYSGYFEGDLSGYIQYRDLAEVMGISAARVRRQLRFFRKIYMKGYVQSKAGHTEQIVLNSKICICECRHCGASIEKRVYYTGVCPYCGNSDLSARVLTDNRFYHIGNQVAEGVKKPEFYATQHLDAKKILFLLYLGLGLSVIVIAIIYCLDNVAHYHDHKYLKELLLSGKSPYSSFALIKAEIMDSIIWGIVLALALVPVVLHRGKKIKYIHAADSCSQYFAQCKKPFVDAGNLPVLTVDPVRNLKSVRGALRLRYLRNCTLEKHEDTLKVALARRIVKDQCPSCGGAIVGAVDEHYQCRYCGNVIMDVIRKK